MKTKTFLLLFILIFSTIQTFKLRGLSEEGITIKKSEGYSEGAYVTWTGPEDDEYAVY